MTTVQDLVDFEIKHGRGGDIVWVGDKIDTRGLDIPRGGGGTQDPIAEAKAAQGAREERLRREQLAAEAAERKRLRDEQRQRDIDRAQKQLQRERGAVARRQRKAKGLPGFDKLPYGKGDTQSERDVGKQEKFFGGGTATPVQPSAFLGTIRPGSGAVSEYKLPPMRRQRLPYQDRGTFTGDQQGALTYDFGHPPTIYESLGEKKVSQKMQNIFSEGRIKKASDIIASPLPKKWEEPTSDFLKAMLSEPVKHPYKFGTEVAVMAALPGVLRAGGAISGISKLGTLYPTATKWTERGVTYGLGAAYAGSAGARIYFSDDKATTAGKIVGGEIIPMGIGLKLGSYGLRRFDTKAELKSYKSKLSDKDLLKFEKGMEYGKDISKIKPKVTELDLRRLKLLEGNIKAQDAITKFMQEKPKIIVGGSVAQQTQLRGVKTKRPGDLDAYVKSLVGEETKSKKYAYDLSKHLRRTNVKAKAKGSKIYVGKEKLVEFHPYKTYLRPNIEQVTSWYKPAGVFIKKTPKGAKVLDIGVQYKRKIVGGYLEPFMSGKHRLKDLPAAEAIRKGLLKDRGGKAGKITMPKSFDISPKSLKGFDVKTKKGGRGTSTSDYYSYKPTRPSTIFSYSYPKAKKKDARYIPKKTKRKPPIHIPRFTPPKIPTIPTSYPLRRSPKKTPYTFASETAPIIFLKIPKKRKKKKGFVFGGGKLRIRSGAPKKPGTEDLAITEGFTARTLQFRPIKIPKVKVPSVERKQKGLGFRRPFKIT